MNDPNTHSSPIEFNQQNQQINQQNNAGRDVNFIVADFSEAIQFLRILAQQQNSTAVEKVVETLRLIARYQKAVSELKDIHNGLHNIEGLLATIEHLALVPPQDSPSLFRQMGVIWRGVKPQYADIEQVAQRIRFCDQPLRSSGNGVLLGPSWIVPVIQWRMDFEQNLKDPVLPSLCDLWLEGIASCRTSLFAVDKALLEATRQLDYLTYRVLVSIGADGVE